MQHQTSKADQQFQKEFETCATELSDFNHRAHVRLAYIYLCIGSIDEAYVQIRRGLLRYLEYNSINTVKYSVTSTRAWIMAVRHFMQSATLCHSAGELVAQYPQLLDGNIMLSHYTKERLFSNEASKRFMQADIEAIPEYAA